MFDQATLSQLVDAFRIAIREEMGDHLVGRPEAARLLKCSMRTIARREESGELERVNKSGRPLYRYSDILNLKK